METSRRQFLRSASSGFGYLAFSALATEQARAATASAKGLAARLPRFPARAKRVIFLCQKGAPSHVDTFDFKPELARRNGALWNDQGQARTLGPNYPFQQHGESGQWIADLFPHLAKHADDLCFLKGMQTDVPNHPQAFAQLHTGSFQFVRPSMGAWTLYGLGTENTNLPGFISLNPPADLGGALNYGSAFLPAIHQGTKIGGGALPKIFAAMTGRSREEGPPLKHLKNPKYSTEAQARQLDFIRQLDQRKLAQEQHQPEVEGAIGSFELAFKMQSEIPDLLDISGESDVIRKMYGIGEPGPLGHFAEQCLMARRLSEAGVRFIEVTAPVEWDHHANLRNELADCAHVTDQPTAALLTDLKRLGLLEDTLVLWGGEFGRTPYAQGIDGRDHNAKAFTMWMAGGGVRPGFTHGASDDLGDSAVEGKVHIHDLHATLLHLLGLDHTKLTFDYGGRNFRLTDVHGKVVREILA